jgi:peptide chain release factor 2
MQERKRLEQAIADEAEVARLTSDLDTLFELGREGENVTADLDREIQRFSERLEVLETGMLLNGPNDGKSAIMAIHPGAGGTESQDWAEMLLRMYLRWAERHNMQAVVTDRLEGEGAGIKSATLEIEGENAYGLLQSEIGVHRLVRISPFDANARRHTSFASVFVFPQIEDDINIDIKPEDIRVDVFRASGAGGQNERSQHKNRASAMKQMRARLYEYEMEKKRAADKKVEDSKLEINFGSQIRSYVLAPYRMVKDHRTKLSIGDVDRVLDGDLDRLMHAFLVYKHTGKIAGDGKEDLPE